MKIYNRGPIDPVRISGIHIEADRDSTGYDRWESVDWNLPWLLDVDEERIVHLTSDEAGVLKRGQKIHATIVTAKGKQFTSEVLEIGTKSSAEYVVIPQGRLDEILNNIPEVKRPKLWGPRVQVFGSSPTDFMPEEWLADE